MDRLELMDELFAEATWLDAEAAKHERVAQAAKQAAHEKRETAIALFVADAQGKARLRLVKGAA